MLIESVSTTDPVLLFAPIFNYQSFFTYFFFLFFTFFRSGNAVLQLHTDVFTFYSIVSMLLCVVCSLIDGVCLSGDKRITYLLTWRSE